MKVLVACEESQEVCKVFRLLGHEAYSCDIQEPSRGHPEWHVFGDALKAIEGGYSVGANADCARDETGKILRWNDPRTARARSKTFPGIAKAMAEQWGGVDGGI